MADQHRARTDVVIVGGGFGGLYAAKALASYKIPFTLVDRRNFHLFQPLLYQVATGRSHSSPDRMREQYHEN